MITVKKKFTLNKSQLARKFRVENNNLDITALINNTGFAVKKISEVASSHREKRDRGATKDKVFKYVQISDIDVNLGRIKSFRKFKGSEAPNNARRLMKCGDVLVSTRRPTRGAIVAVPKEFNQEICTVFFTSLTVHNWEEVDPWYLALFLRTSLGRFQFQSMITETAYPVISDEDVESMVVLLPPINVQRSLAHEYEEAVKNFFSKLNEAYSSITSSRQKIESYILKEEAEILEAPKFGIEVEEIIENNGNNSAEESGEVEQPKNI